MREMSGLIFQAKELHYDSATMLMKLKAEMQVGSFLISCLLVVYVRQFFKTFIDVKLAKCHQLLRVHYLLHLVYIM